MARRLLQSEADSAPRSFTLGNNDSREVLEYDCQLITPMAGGGIRSWVVDLNNPVRSQSVKGQLRFWWRTMTAFRKPEELKQREDEVWGSTATAGKVRLQVKFKDKPTRGDIITIEKNDKGILQFAAANLPGYVLFPLQNQKDLHTFQVLGNARFTLCLELSDPALRAEIENSVQLWLLFGGLGARTRRGCGSLYCPEVMGKFQHEEDLLSFVKNLQTEPGYEPYSAPFPVLANCRLAIARSPKNTDPAGAWRSFLDSYGQFRQGPGIGRNPVKNRRPGRTRWPEADAIRRITKKASKQHTPEHPAGNWFPRGAYGMPVQTEFKNAPGDPTGKFSLQPKGHKRWPSPVILKVIKLNDSTVLKVCLILNHAVPQAILKGETINHELIKEEAPLSYKGKIMPPKAAMLRSGENPYDALIRHLALREVK